MPLSVFQLDNTLTYSENYFATSGSQSYESVFLKQFGTEKYRKLTHLRLVVIELWECSATFPELLIPRKVRNGSHPHRFFKNTDAKKYNFLARHCCVFWTTSPFPVQCSTSTDIHEISPLDPPLVTGDLRFWEISSLKLEKIGWSSWKILIVPGDPGTRGIFHGYQLIASSGLWRPPSSGTLSEGLRSDAECYVLS